MGPRAEFTLALRNAPPPPRQVTRETELFLEPPQPPLRNAGSTGTLTEPEETGRRRCAEDTGLTESFHDRVGVQDALFDPLGNLVAFPGRG